MGCKKGEQCPNTRYECDQWTDTCVCDHSMLFYGEGCLHTHPFVSISFSVLMFLSLALFFLSCRTFYIKLRARKSVASINASLLSLVADASSVCLCTSNFSRSLNVGNQNTENKTLNPIAISIVGISTFLSSLNVCLLWIELSADAKISNPRKTKSILLVIAVSYTLWLVFSYIITRQVVWWFILDIFYALILIAFLQKGSGMISSRLESATTRFLKTNKKLRGIPVQVKANSKVFVTSRPNIRRNRATKQGAQLAPKVMKRYATKSGNPEGKPFHIRNIQQIKRIQTSSKIVSFLYGLLATSALAFVVTLYFPQAGAFTCICAFTMISSQLCIRFIILEYLSGPKSAATKILYFSCEVVSQFRQIMGSRDSNAVQ